MGYTTNFYGEFTLDKTLTPEQADILRNLTPNDKLTPDCGWIPTPKRDGICWDGSEKFYEYITWLEYTIEHFLEPWGYILNGEVDWCGEGVVGVGINRRNDCGKIIVTDNAISIIEL